MSRRELMSELENMLDLNPRSLTENTKLSDIGWDSMANLAFMSFVDSKFSIIISPKDLTNAKLVSDLLKLISTNIEE